MRNTQTGSILWILWSCYRCCCCCCPATGCANLNCAFKFNRKTETTKKKKLQHNNNYKHRYTWRPVCQFSSVQLIPSMRTWGSKKAPPSTAITITTKNHSELGMGMGMGMGTPPAPRNLEKPRKTPSEKLFHVCPSVSVSVGSVLKLRILRLGYLLCTIRHGQYAKGLQTYFAH